MSSFTPFSTTIFEKNYFTLFENEEMTVRVRVYSAQNVVVRVSGWNVVTIVKTVIGR
jgi:hypothetical protein